jgi:hypothetical protein
MREEVVVHGGGWGSEDGDLQPAGSTQDRGVCGDLVCELAAADSRAGWFLLYGEDMRWAAYAFWKAAEANRGVRNRARSRAAGGSRWGCCPGSSHVRSVRTIFFFDRTYVSVLPTRAFRKLVSSCSSRVLAGCIAPVFITCAKLRGKISARGVLIQVFE